MSSASLDVLGAQLRQALALAGRPVVQLPSNSHAPLVTLACQPALAECQSGPDAGAEANRLRVVSGAWFLWRERAELKQRATWRGRAPSECAWRAARFFEAGEGRRAVAAIGAWRSLVRRRTLRLAVHALAARLFLARLGRLVLSAWSDAVHDADAVRCAQAQLFLARRALLAWSRASVAATRLRAAESAASPRPRAQIERSHTPGLGGKARHIVCAEPRARASAAALDVWRARARMLASAAKAAAARTRAQLRHALATLSGPRLLESAAEAMAAHTRARLRRALAVVSGRLRALRALTAAAARAAARVRRALLARGLRACIAAARSAVQPHRRFLLGSGWRRAQAGATRARQSLALARRGRRAAARATRAACAVALDLWRTAMAARVPAHLAERRASRALSRAFALLAIAAATEAAAALAISALSLWQPLRRWLRRAAHAARRFDAGARACAQLRMRRVLWTWLAERRARRRTRAAEAEGAVAVARARLRAMRGALDCLAAARARTRELATAVARRLARKGLGALRAHVRGCALARAAAWAALAAKRARAVLRAWRSVSGLGARYRRILAASAARVVTAQRSARLGRSPANARAQVDHARARDEEARRGGGAQGRPLSTRADVPVRESRAVLLLRRWRRRAAAARELVAAARARDAADRKRDAAFGESDVAQHQSVAPQREGGARARPDGLSESRGPSALRRRAAAEARGVASPAPAALESVAQTVTALAVQILIATQQAQRRAQAPHGADGANGAERWLHALARADAPAPQLDGNAQEAGRAPGPPPSNASWDAAQPAAARLPRAQQQQRPTSSQPATLPSGPVQPLPLKHAKAATSAHAPRRSAPALVAPTNQRPDPQSAECFELRPSATSAPPPPLPPPPLPPPLAAPGPRAPRPCAERRESADVRPAAAMAAAAPASPLGQRSQQTQTLALAQARAETQTPLTQTADASTGADAAQQTTPPPRLPFLAAVAAEASTQTASDQMVAQAGAAQATQQARRMLAFPASAATESDTPTTALAQSGALAADGRSARGAPTLWSADERSRAIGAELSEHPQVDGWRGAPVFSTPISVVRQQLSAETAAAVAREYRYGSPAVASLVAATLAGAPALRPPSHDFALAGAHGEPGDFRNKLHAHASAALDRFRALSSPAAALAWPAYKCMHNDLNQTRANVMK